MLIQLLLTLFLVFPAQPVGWLRYDDRNTHVYVEGNENGYIQDFKIATQPPSTRNKTQPLATPSVYADSLTVYVFLEDECRISQFYTNELTRLFEKYQAQHIGFVGYFPSATTGLEQIAAFAREFKLAFPMYPDHDKAWARKFGITVTPEVAVWDHRSGQMIYRGRIDDSYVRVGKRKLHPQNHDLEDIIIAWQLHQAPENLIVTQAIGCFITFTKE